MRGISEAGFTSAGGLRADDPINARAGPESRESAASPARGNALARGGCAETAIGASRAAGTSPRPAAVTELPCRRRFRRVSGEFRAGTPYVRALGPLAPRIEVLRLRLGEPVDRQAHGGELEGRDLAVDLLGDR